MLGYAFAPKDTVPEQQKTLGQQLGFEADVRMATKWLRKAVSHDQSGHPQRVLDFYADAKTWLRDNAEPAELRAEYQ